MFGNSKKKDVLTSLTHDTADILGAFTNTINGLTDVAEKAEAEASSKKAEAQKLLADADQLATLATKNTRIAQKLQSTIDWEG